MTLTARQLRAIGYCAKKYDRKLSLNAPPYICFVDRETGEETRLLIDEVLDIYDTGRKEDAKERARLKKATSKK